MEDSSKDYLSNYRSFFESLLKSVDLDYPLPVKVANYNLTEHEIAGEITTWCLQYLNERDCPTSLASILCRRVLEEISRLEPELCGYRPQEQVYHPLKLMQETIRKLAEVCTLYTDNARLSELPPPPSSILYDPIISMYGIKNGRRTMEDRHIAIQDLHRLFNVKNAVGPASYYAVFDGHNGCDAATYANCHLHHYLVQSVHYPHNPEAALREAFTTTDKRFIEKTAKGSSESGTTAVCALIRPEESMLYLAWLGDSQAILVSRGGAFQLVKPHRPDQPNEMTRIIQMGGSVLYVGTWRVDGNLAVSRAIGDKMYKPYIVSEPDIRVVPLTGKEDYLILASDGLWDFLSEKMVVHAVASYLAENKGAAGGVSKHLVQLAKKQLSRDNISCITIFLRDPSELADNKDCSTSSMEVHDLEQPASVVDQLWMRHPNEAVGGKHNGRMDEDDMGPETDVDSVDDVLLSPSIAAAKAMVSQVQANTTTTTTTNTSVWPQDRLQKEQQIWLQTLPWSYADVVRKSAPKKATVKEDIKVNMVTQAEIPVVPPLPVQHEAQLDTTVLCNTQEEKEKQEEEALVQQILQDPAVITKGEEIKNYVGDNDIDSGEESEEEWNYIPGKENPKETQKQIQQTQQELNVDEEDMESQLNPNAAEFVPVFIPPNSAAAVEQDLSSSPAKGAEQSLENIDVPNVKEFYTEISKRPSELESLNEDTNISFNETTLNGVNITGSSTKAVYGDDTLNFLSNSTVPNVGEEEDEAIEIAVPLNDTNPFSPTHVATEPVIGNSADTIQEQMVQDHFSLGFKPFDPMTQSAMEDEGQHEDETSPDIDFMSSGKPELLSPETNQAPIGGAEANEALEAQTSSSGFDSESGPDDGDHIPAEQCNLAAAAAEVGISFGEDINIDDIVNNTKSMSLIDDSHPIEKIEQTISPSISPIPVIPVKEGIEKQEMDDVKADIEIKEEIVTKVLTEIKDVKSTLPEELPVTSKADETLLQFTDEEISTPAANNVESFDIPVHTISPCAEENDKVTVEEISVKGITPRQFIDWVQGLQFNQVKSKEEEPPESDSGFEIINASEASNEPDLIESETSSRLQHTVEGSVELNYVPDLLLQPTESETDRQPSPVGTGTGDIVADIEGAMLDSTPPMEQTMPEVCSLDTVGSKVKEQKLEETASPLLFEEEKVTDEHIEPRKSTLPDDLEKQEIVTPTLEVDDHVQVILKKSLPEIEDNEQQTNEPQPSVFEERNERPLTPKEEIAESLTIDETKEVIKETISVEEDKSTEMGESPILDVGIKSSFENTVEEKVVEKTLITETAAPFEEIKEPLMSMDIDKEEQPLAETKAKEEVCEFKEEIKEQEPLVEMESKLIEEEKEILLEVNEDKVMCEEVLASQPTPPTTPAPGVTQLGNQQELIAAAIAAAGVAVAGAGAAAVAVSVTESPKVEEKTPTVQKKPGAPIAKKLDTSKTPTAKSSPITAKSPAKPSALTTTTKKPSTAVGTSTKGTKPASTAKPSTASSKPSTPISKTAPTNRPPSAKPSTPTSKTSTVSAATKSPLKPRTPTSAKSAPTTTAKAPTGPVGAKPAKPTSQTSSARPPTVAATKKPEPAAIKKTVSNITTAAKSTAPTAKAAAAPSKPTSAPKLSVAKPGSVTATKSLVSKAATSTATSTKPSATPSSTAKLATTKTNVTTTTKTPAAKAPLASKTLNASKSTSANSTATKAPVSKTKPAAPTAIKKPQPNDKNIKEATNNKLSAAKQMGPVKKQEVKVKPTNETKEIEPLTQEQTVTTTNGHFENGISNEESSPVEIAYPPIVQALN